MCGVEELVQSDWDEYCAALLRLLDADPSQGQWTLPGKPTLQTMAMSAIARRMDELKRLRKVVA